MNDFLNFLLTLCSFMVLVLLPGAVFSVALNYLLSLPMRRRDRALFFLDLLETVVSRGQPVEQAILSAAENHDRSIGVEFFKVAAHIEDGARLGEALEKAPGFLPPQVNAMIRAGEKLGNLNKILPACREVLRVTPDTTRSSLHYMITILMIFAPIAIWVITILSRYVLPKFKDVAAGMGIAIWPLARFVFVLNDHYVLVSLEVLLFLSLLAVAVLYIGGPALIRRFQFRRVPVVDWIIWRIPWKQKKLLRAFSAMLAVLLDNGVSEPVAIWLAGEATANEICRRRAQRVVTALQQGAKLDDAIRAFDDNGEFRWRLANATHGRGGFLDALRGWHGALDTKAFQQEETAAHALASGLVILNGIVVGLIAISMFGLLVMMLRATVAAT